MVLENNYVLGEQTASKISILINLKGVLKINYKMLTPWYFKTWMMMSIRYN